MKPKNTTALEAAFRRECGKPITHLERLATHLEAALDVARDADRPEADRLAELRKRLALLPVDI